MKPSAPSRLVWLLGLLSGIAGILGHIISISILSPASTLLLMIGFVLLALGTTFKNL